MTYDRILIGFAGLCAALSLLLMAAPWLVLTLFGLENDVAAQVITRRAAVLFCGLFLLAPALRAVQDRAARRLICRALAVMMLALALLGGVEWALGRAGPMILLASAVELVFGAGFLRLMKHPD